MSRERSHPSEAAPDSEPCYLCMATGGVLAFRADSRLMVEHEDRRSFEPALGGLTRRRSRPRNSLRSIQRRISARSVGQTK
jgi:hypothetical protein